MLGILSLLGCTVLTGIPAIICGILARKRARETPESHGGDGLALGGIITGSVGSALVVVFAILAGLLLPSLSQAKGKAQSIGCVNHMKQICLAVRMWSNDHQEVLPPDFLSMSNELSSPKILTCPSDGSRTRMTDWSQVNPKNVTYIYSGAGLKESPATFQTTILTCPIHGHVGLGDGSVQQAPGRGGWRGGQP